MADTSELRKALRALLKEVPDGADVLALVREILEEMSQPGTPVPVVLNRTCDACPEQYEVFRDERQIGYMRLRHGYFSVSYPDHGGKEVYRAQPQGDDVFEDHERDFYLEQGLIALLEADGEVNPTPVHEPVEPVSFEVEEDFEIEMFERFMEESRRKREEREKLDRQKVSELLRETIADTGIADPQSKFLFNALLERGLIVDRLPDEKQ